MVRWIKLFRDQYLGFWALGLLLFALQEIPYMVMPMLHLETNPIMNMTETSAALNICEKVLGSLCIALMVFVVHRDAVLFSIAPGRERLFFSLAVILLLANYTISVGNPARELRKRFDDELIDLMLRFRWWDKSIEEIDSLIPILTCSDLEKVRAELKARL